MKDSLSTVSDPARAADLFARILRAVREQTQEVENKRNSGETAA